MTGIDAFRHGLQRRNFGIRCAACRNADEDEEEKKEEEREEDEDEKEERDSEEGEDEKKEEEERSSDEDEEKPEEEEERSAEEDEEDKEERNSDEEEEKPEEEEERDEDEDKKEERGLMIVEGYASTFDSPYQLFRSGGIAVYEKIERSAFDGAKMSDVIFQYDHEGRVLARQSNGTLGVMCDAHGLYMRADLSGTKAGRELYKEIRGGYTTKMSFGFMLEESDFEEVAEEDILGFSTGSLDRCYLHTIRKVSEVFDVSAVSLPANGGTAISARSRRALGNEGWRARLALEAELALAL